MLKTVYYVDLADLLTPDEMEVYSNWASVSFGDANFTLVALYDLLLSLEDSGMIGSRIDEIGNAFNAACAGLPPKARVYVNLEN